MSTDTGAQEAVDPRKRQIAMMSFKKGTEAMAKENWSYAIEMFTVCAKMEPGNLMFRQSLRGCEYRLYKNNKSGASMAGMRLMGVRSKVKKARGAKNWADLDAAAEEGLAINPWDPQLNADLGEAAYQRGHLTVATFAYEKAVEGEPNNKEFLEKFAEVLRATGEYDRAAAQWEKIYKLDPLNGRARSMITQLASEKTIDRSGMDTAKTTREVKQGYEASVKGHTEEVLSPGDSPEHDLQRAIRKDPANKDNYHKLADLYRRETRLQEAFDMYMKAHEVSGDLTVREQAEDVQLEIMRRNLDAAREYKSQHPDEEQAKENYQALDKELLDREIEVFSRRTERYPNDMKLKFELAQRFMRVRKFSLATKLLQQASKDIRIEGPVLLNLGKCFLAEKQNALALRQFEKAVEKFNSADNPKELCELHYLLGRLYEDAKDLDATEKHYLEVLALDYDYRDAKKRLEEIQRQRGDTGLSDLGEL